MYCRKCGQELPDDSTFCSKCGEVQSVQQAPAGQTAITTPPPIQQAVQAIVGATGIVLDAPTPYPDKIKTLNALMLLCIPLILAGGIGLIGLLVLYMVRDFVATKEIITMRNAEYALFGPYTKETVSGKLMMPLMQMGMTVTLLSNEIRVSKGRFQYDITVDPVNQTFAIWPQKNIASRLMSRSAAPLFKESMTTLPLIAFTIQQQMKQQ